MDDALARWRAHVTSPAFAEAARSLARAGVSALARAPLDALVAPASARAFASAVGRDDAARALEQALGRAFDEGFARLRGEPRSLRALLGEEVAESLAALAERADPPPALVRAALEESAAEALMANVLYHGILEFLRKADLLGPFIDQIPVLGGLRRRILAAVQDGFERRAEQTVKGALGQLAKGAVERAIAFLLAPENRATFRAARRRAVERALARPVQDLIPEPARVDDLRREVLARARRALADGAGWERRLEEARARAAGMTLDDLRERWGAPDLREAALPALTDLLLCALASEAVMAWFAAHPLPPPAPGGEGAAG